MACAARSMHFFPFIFTGGPRGSKTQVYRDYASYIQKGQVRAPNPNGLQADHKRLMERWLRQHIDLEYVMDTANKTERISAPATKHDDFCDSCVIAIHATLSMLPASSTFTSVSINKPTDYGDMNRTWNKTSGILTSKMRSNKMMKKAPRGI